MSPLQSRVRLKALTEKNFREGLQITVKIGMSEIRKRLGSGRLGGSICGELSGFVSDSRIQTNSVALIIGEKGCGKVLCRLLPHNSD